MKITLHHLIIFIAALVFGCETTSNVKSPDKDYFVKYFGQDGNQYAVDLIANADGTFFILGNSGDVPSQQRVYLAKADAQGNLIKQIISDSVGISARDFELINGKLVVVANKFDKTNNNWDVLLTRFDTDLTVQTSDSVSLQLEFATSKNVYANSVTGLSDGGYLVVGYTDYVGSSSRQIDALQFRVDVNLRQYLFNTNAWSETTGAGNKSSISKAFVAPSDTSFYCLGSTTAGGADENFWAFELGGTHGGPVQNSDQSNEFVIPISDEIVTNAIKVAPGGYLMTGVTVGQNQNMSILAKRLKSDILQFDVTDVEYTYQSGSLGKPASQFSQFATACATASGFFVLSNTYNTTSGASDLYLVKLDLLLQEVWKTPVTMGGDGEDTAAAVAELSDGHIIVLGTMNIGNKPEQFKIALMKLNSSGRLAN